MQKKKKICAVYGEGAVTDRMCQKWFAKFRAGDFSLDDDALQSGRPVEVDSDHIGTLMKYHQCYTTQEIANILKISKINKVIGGNEKCIFYFTGKTKQTCWPIQYYGE